MAQYTNAKYWFNIQTLGIDFKNNLVNTQNPSIVGTNKTLDDTVGSIPQYKYFNKK